MNLRIWKGTLIRNGNFIASALCIMICAAVASGHPARFHKDRASGVGRLTIDLDGTDADILFSAVSADVFGFSEPPLLKDEAGNKVVEEVRRRVKAFGDKLIRFPDKLNCRTRVRIIGEFVGDHGSLQGEPLFSENEPMDPFDEADVRAALQVPKNDLLMRIAVHCAQDIAGSELKFSFSSHFPRIQQVKAYVFEGINIRASTIQNDQGSMIP
jgi:hypothetical protein